MKKYLTVIGVALIAGCATEPALQTGPDAEMTYDGLARIDNSAFRDAWADPDADWARYDKIMPGKAFFEFRAVKKSTRSSARTMSSQDEYWISDENKQKLIDEVSSVFAEALSESERFTIVDKPGPDVLIVSGGLHDIVSRVPPDYIGRSDIYLSSVGEATIILEIADSLSGEVLARGVERRSAERAGSRMQLSTTVTNWAEVRRMARTWATKLRNGLDRMPTE